MPSGFEIAAVRSTAVEPGLGDALQSQMGSALARRGVGDTGPAIELQIWDASTRVIGIEGRTRVLSARLEIEVLAAGPRPRRPRRERWIETVL